MIGDEVIDTSEPAIALSLIEIVRTLLFFMNVKMLVVARTEEIFCHLYDSILESKNSYIRPALEFEDRDNRPYQGFEPTIVVLSEFMVAPAGKGISGNCA